jgi:sec-independent protein translocase protein TatA
VGLSDCERVLMLGTLGTAEIGLIVVAVVILFGAKRLPELARSIGTSARELRRGLEEDEPAEEEESVG